MNRGRLGPGGGQTSHLFIEVNHCWTRNITGWVTIWGNTLVVHLRGSGWRSNCQSPLPTYTIILCWLSFNHPQLDVSKVFFAYSGFLPYEIQYMPVLTTPTLCRIFNRPFAASDHVVQNRPCWRASSLLFPLWDIKTKRPEPVKLDLPLF